jgi:hypothetical protein
MIERRSFLSGLISLVAAPAIVRAGSLMPVRVMLEEPRYLTGSAIKLMQQASDAEWRAMIEAQREINMRHSLVMARRWITKAEALEMFPDREAIA